MKLGALIDGLAIQVLMNDTQVNPQHMQRMRQEVAASLIGRAGTRDVRLAHRSPGHRARSRPDRDLRPAS